MEGLPKGHRSIASELLNEANYIMEQAIQGHKKDMKLPFWQKKPKIKTRINLYVEILETLTPEERLEIFGNFCVHCGTSCLPCHCWDDE